MSQQSYLIDTNILIGLEDYHQVNAVYARFLSLSAAHKANIYVHEVARDDLLRDKHAERRKISLSKIKKYRVLNKRRGLTKAELDAAFGPLKKLNDVVDATLLQALECGAVDFLVTQDKGLHERAQRHSVELARRVLFVVDATELLVQTYEPKAVPIRHVAEVVAHEIDPGDGFFDSLREGYPEFDDWWREKCVKQHRPCWVVYDDGALAGLIVRKDETAADTDALSAAEKILKVCTFKIARDKRGVRLGELLLKQVLWYAQTNGYDLAYLTAFEEQASLIYLLEYYGFTKTGTNARGELIYERTFLNASVSGGVADEPFRIARLRYPRFVVDLNTRGFGIPIREKYHDTLYPDLWSPRQCDLFAGAFNADTPTRPGNTIRKVYLSRAPSRLGPPGSVLFFYKLKSRDPPSQAITALGILESVSEARSTKELMQMTGGRSVYSEEELEGWKATSDRPVKVINFLLQSYVEPPISLDELRALGVVGRHPQQAIYEFDREVLAPLVKRANLAFTV